MPSICGLTLSALSLCDDIISCSDAVSRLVNCHNIAIDIETSPAFLDVETKSDPQHIISCVGYRGITFTGVGNSFAVHSFVIPCKSMEKLKWIRKSNQLPQPKLFQNGKCDDFYFLRFGAPEITDAVRHVLTDVDHGPSG